MTNCRLHYVRYHALSSNFTHCGITVISVVRVYWFANSNKHEQGGSEGTTITAKKKKEEEENRKRAGQMRGAESIKKKKKKRRKGSVAREKG